MSSCPPEPGAFIDSETLFRFHGRFVAGFLRRLGISESDVDDLVQEVFMTAHRRGGYRPGSASPTTFLARIALEARLAHRRRGARWTGAHSVEFAQASAGCGEANPEQVFCMQRAAGELQTALEKMSPAHSAVFVLFELHGESCQSIASGLGVKVGTVYSRLHAARRAFGEHVEGLS